jgi:hypothetical protein
MWKHVEIERRSSKTRKEGGAAVHKMEEKIL